MKPVESFLPFAPTTPSKAPALFSISRLAFSNSSFAFSAPSFTFEIRPVKRRCVSGEAVELNKVNNFDDGFESRLSIKLSNECLIDLLDSKI